MSYEKNIVEIKNEYTTFITNIITPSIFEGIKSLYTKSIEIHNKFEEQQLRDPNAEGSPGILKIFQTCLKDIPSLNNNAIEREAERIRVSCKCSEWFDDLIKAVIKSNIVLLTFNGNNFDLVNQKHHERIDVNDFIHKCYIESARIIYNNPELFWHEFPPLEIKRNQRDACELIKVAIKEGIRKMLPMKLILQEYLKNDYTEDLKSFSRIPHSQYANIRSMVARDMETPHYKALESEYPTNNEGHEGYEGHKDDEEQEVFQGKHEEQTKQEIKLPNTEFEGGKQIFEQNEVKDVERDDGGQDNFFEEINDDEEKKNHEEDEKIIMNEQPLDILKGKLDEISNKIIPPRKMSKTGLELQRAVEEFKSRNKGNFFSKYYT